MKPYWIVLSIMAFCGIIVGLVFQDRLTFGFNAVLFLFDIYMLGYTAD